MRKTQKATDAPCGTNQGPKQPVCSYCRHLRIVTKCSEKLQEAPHAVGGWSVIPTAKIREGTGEILEHNLQTAYKRFPMSAGFQNFVFVPNFEPGPPPTSRLLQALWHVTEVKRRREGGLCRDSSYSVCLRLLGWGGG